MRLRPEGSRPSEWCAPLAPSVVSTVQNVWRLKGNGNRRIGEASHTAWTAVRAGRGAAIGAAARQLGTTGLGRAARWRVHGVRTDAVRLHVLLRSAFTATSHLLHRAKADQDVTPSYRGLQRASKNELLRLRGGGGDGGVYLPTHAEMKWMTSSEMGTTAAGASERLDKASEETPGARTVRRGVFEASAVAIVMCEPATSSTRRMPRVPSQQEDARPPRHTVAQGAARRTLHANPEHKGITSDAEPPFYAMLPMNGCHLFVFSADWPCLGARLPQVGGKLCPTGRGGAQWSGRGQSRSIRPEDVVLADRIAAKKDAKKDRSSKAKATEAPRETELPAGGKRPVPHPTSSGGGGNSCGKASTAESATGSAPELRGKLPAAPAAVAAGPSASRAQPLAADRKRPHREWEERIEQRASESSVYMSLFLSADDARQEEEAANFCARGIVLLSRSTKFGTGEGTDPNRRPRHGAIRSAGRQPDGHQPSKSPPCASPLCARLEWRCRAGDAIGAARLIAAGAAVWQ